MSIRRLSTYSVLFCFFFGGAECLVAISVYVFHLLVKLIFYSSWCFRSEMLPFRIGRSFIHRSTASLCVDLVSHNFIVSIWLYVWAGFVFSVYLQDDIIYKSSFPSFQFWQGSQEKKVLFFPMLLHFLFLLPFFYFFFLLCGMQPRALLMLSKCFATGW